MKPPTFCFLLLSVHKRELKADCLHLGDTFIGINKALILMVSTDTHFHSPTIEIRKIQNKITHLKSACFNSVFRSAVKYEPDAKTNTGMLSRRLDKCIKKIPRSWVKGIPRKIFLNLDSPLSNRSRRLQCN